MTLEQICSIGKVEINDENTKIIKSYQQYIIPWLNSDKFKDHWANKPYPPLIDPDKMEWGGSDALHAWTLNLPLPKFYDFVVFGSHGVGISTAMNRFLWMCKAVAVCCNKLAKINEKDEKENPSNKANYVNMLKHLVFFEGFRKAQAKRLEDKEIEAMSFKYVYLQLNDFINDSDAKKFYSLIDASLALHIVRDPISNLKSLVNNPQMITHTKYEDDENLKKFALNFNTNAKKTLSKVIIYPQGGAFEKKKMQKIGEGGEMNVRPCIDSIDYWMLDNTQTFHDGALFTLLSGSLNKIKLKQTTDFIGEKSYDCMCEICEFFGLDKPDEKFAPIFAKRAANSVGFLPLSIYADDKTEFFDKKFGAGAKFNAASIKNSAKIILSSANDPVAKLSRYDISEYFKDVKGFDDSAMLISTGADDLVKLLAPNMMKKLKYYIKSLLKAIDEIFEEHYKYRFSEDDVLEYFRQNKRSRQVMNYILNQHLYFLSTHKPDVVKNYKWYQKFLELCKDDEPLENSDVNFSVTSF